MVKGLYGISNKEKNSFLKMIEEKYVKENRTVKEIAEELGMETRCVRYLLNNYLLIKKGKGKRRKKEVTPMEESDKIELDDGCFIFEDHIAKKATLKDLVEKMELAKKETKINKSTNIKVEN